MFAHSWVNAFRAEVLFVCPRGCTMTRIQGIYNKMSNKQAISIIYSFDPEKKYHNHCWNCDGMVDSKVCARDAIPSLGFICTGCGKSLRQRFERDGIITTHPITIPPVPIEIVIVLPVISSV
jgi:hypothetical protein